jgi:hypothetical protein
VAIGRFGEAVIPTERSNVTGAERTGVPISMAGTFDDRMKALAGDENRLPATGGLRREPRDLLGESRENDLMGDMG